MAPYTKLPLSFEPAAPYLEEFRNGAGIDPSASIVYKNPRLTVLHGPAVLSSGMPVADFTSYTRAGAVTVIPWHSKCRMLVMIRKIKTASGIAYYTFPGGTLSAGDDPLALANQELDEEAGLRAKRIVPLSFTGRRPESSADVEHLYLAFVDSLKDMHGDQDEGVVTKAVSLDDALVLHMTQHVEESSAVALWRALPHLGNWPQTERAVGRAIKAARCAAGIKER